MVDKLLDASYDEEHEFLLMFNFSWVNIKALWMTIFIPDPDREARTIYNGYQLMDIEEYN